jgi:hypothetical protein
MIRRRFEIAAGAASFCGWRGSHVRYWVVAGDAPMRPPIAAPRLDMERRFQKKRSETRSA